MASNYLYSICGEISWELASKAIDNIYEAYIEEKFDHLIVLLATPGGDLDAGWALYSGIRHLGCKTSTVANGRLYSAGVVAYLAGDVRYVYPESIQLFHPTTIEVKEGESRASPRILDELLDFKMDDELFKQLLVKTLTKATKKDINRLTHKYKSCFVDDKEAVRLGLANGGIIENISQIK